MMHPHTTCKMVNEKVGLGVFATEDLPKGTITWACDGLDIRIENNVFEKLPPVCRDYIDKYSYVNDTTQDCIINWDHARYMNHCCHSNTLCTAYNFDVAIVDIKKGEELTCDYRMLDSCEIEMTLSCSKENCMKVLKNQKLSPSLINIWDEKIREALHELQKVHQPLSSIVQDVEMQDVLDFLHKRRSYKSLMTAIAYLSDCH